MRKQPTFQEHIEALDRSYQEHGISVLHNRSYTELGFLVMRKQNQLEGVTKRVQSSGEPDPADVRRIDDLDRQRVEIFGAFRTRLRATIGIELPEAKRRWPSIENLDLEEAEIEIE